MTQTTFALFLPCGCPCSFVIADGTTRAVEILFNRDKQAGARYVIRPVDRVRHTAVIEELRKARGRRFECRRSHGATT